MKYAALAMLLFAMPALAQELPDKPVPQRAFQGEWIAAGEIMPAEWPEDLVLTDRKNDGRRMWQVVKVGSCAFCGKPMTFTQAAFDKKAMALWGARMALLVADVEITHRSPCFNSGHCREINPIMGKTRAQSYTVGAGFQFGMWLATGWLRKGDRSNHVGGSKYWYIIPIVGSGMNVLGIVNNTSKWNR